jgi:ABC-2 type transport system permease protein
MWLRVSGLMLRYLYLYRRSLVRIGEICFWPVMNLLMWGFLSVYMQRTALPGIVGFFLGAMILWDMFYRAQMAISMALTEEMWVKNILNVWLAPVSLGEIILAMCLLGLLKALVNAVVLSVLAYVLHAFNLLDLGFAIIPLFANVLLFAWAMGMATMAVILRYGMAGEGFGWAAPFLIQPFAAVFYPVTVFPPWLQTVAYCLPLTYVFEGMRAVLYTGTLNTSMLLAAFGLNLVYLAAGAAFLSWMLWQARWKGYLSRLGLH